MSDFSANMRQLNTFEEMSVKNTVIHRMHPIAKIMVTLVFIIVVISSDRFDFALLLPYFAYIFILSAISETPYKLLLTRTVYALPFCIFAGVSNIIFERNTALTICGFDISFGTLSFVTIIVKVYLTVTAVLLLTATTKMNDISKSLIKLKVPAVIVMQVSMTYRYLAILANEASSMLNAYIIRSNGKKGIDIKHMGSFAGQLLLRSFDRAERVYNAMKCLGYNGKYSYSHIRNMNFYDILYCIGLCGIFILLRVINFSNIIGDIL